VTWTSIRYADFWDVPRVFALEHDDSLYVFYCPFDEQTDDYALRYTVYRIPETTLSSVSDGAWQALIDSGEKVGQCAVADIRFDAFHPTAVDDAVLVRGLTSA
jgi:hypothetical protein